MRNRLGVVSYLNTQPLVHAFESGGMDHSFDLIYDLPSRCADRLHEGKTDVALIPSVEIERGPEPYFVVPNVGISSFGPVRSVLLISKKDPREIQSLALDTSSRTSIVLSQILLRKRYGSAPEVFPSLPNLDQMLKQADAALLIGDPTFEVDSGCWYVMDLGQAWTEWTGLPFVYAFWTGREGVLSSSLVEELVEARKIGMRDISLIAKRYAASHSLSADFYTEYLSQYIGYNFAEKEVEGLDRFYAYAYELGLLESVPKIQFFPRS